MIVAIRGAFTGGGARSLAPLSLLLLPLLLLLAGNALAASLSPEQPRPERRAKASSRYQRAHQDPASGAYQYGYAGPHHAKSESNFDGVTRGGYSYIDANGHLQTVSYTADAENGFRVHASNLPHHNALAPVQDTPEVAMAKKRHLEQLRRVELNAWQQPDEEQELEYQPSQSNGYALDTLGARLNPYLLTPQEARGISAPRSSNAIVVEAASSAASKQVERLKPHGFVTSSGTIHNQFLVPVAPTAYAFPLSLLHTSMRHSQDSLGQYEYSYTGDTSAKTESRSLDGTTRGAYSYIDANGLLQQVHYIADRGGFRVLATNLPEA